MIWRGVIFLFFVCVSASSNAATITVVPNAKDASQAIIFIEGDLILKDIDDFRAKISQFPRGTVVLQSRGGLVVTGIEIGRIIRLRNFSTWVPSGFTCASACAAAWLGGSPRAMGKGALIGSHAAYHMEDGKLAESGVANAVLGSYLGQLGLPDRAIIYLTSSAPTSMTYLTPTDAAKLGIEVAVFDLPDEVGKSVTPSNAPSLENRTLEFIISQYQRFSGSNVGLLAWARGRYADQASYFGKMRLRDDILKEVAFYLDRWPTRNYQPRKVSFDLVCNHSTQTCDTNGLLDFEAVSIARREKSTGVATFEFTISFASTEPRIVREAGRTLQLHKEALTSQQNSTSTYSVPRNPLGLAPR